MASAARTSNEQPDLPNLGLLSDTEYDDLIEDTKFERYASAISPWTFRSETFALSKAQCSSLVQAFEAHTIVVNDSNEQLKSIASSIDQAKAKLSCSRIFVRSSLDSLPERRCY